MEHRLPGLAPDDRLIHNTALAGLLWCKKYYGWSVLRWLEGDPTQPTPPANRWDTDTALWSRLHAHHVISMPDAWEYPYFCQWDLMFHAVAFGPKPFGEALHSVQKGQHFLAVVGGVGKLFSTFK